MTMNPLHQDFHDFIALLEANAVEYLVVGGYAVALHGFPRYTGNIDFFVEVTPQNANALLNVFQQFGFGDLGLSSGDFLQEDFVIEIGREPRKIQVLTGIDGVRFAECKSARVHVDIGGLEVKFIDRDNLLRNKRASGRAKDLIDVQALENIPQSPVQ
jgi:hypothetical protein